jgi:hypothetical protein
MKKITMENKNHSVQHEYHHWMRSYFFLSAGTSRQQANRGGGATTMQKFEPAGMKKGLNIFCRLIQSFGSIAKESKHILVDLPQSKVSKFFSWQQGGMTYRKIFRPVKLPGTI